MSKTKILLIGAAILMAASANLEAQRGGGRGGRMNMFGGQGSAEQIKLQLLRMEEVQDELKMESDDADKISDIMADVQDEMRAEMQEMMRDAGNFREMSDEDRTEFRKKMTKVMGEINGEAWKEISKLVSKDQMKRLDQLVLQRQGPRALLNKDLQKSLEITDEQAKKMKAKNEELQKEMNEEMQAAREDRDFEAMQEARQNYNTASKEALLKILTDDQTKKLKEMMGKDFKFPERQRRGRGRV